MLTFLGPVLVLIGTEIIPHLFNPCYYALQLGRRYPSVCEYAEWGADFSSRWHLANHTLVGAIPLVLLYRLAIRKWRFDSTAFAWVDRRRA